MNESMQPGDVVIPHDIIDFTKMRVSSFYDEPPVTHIDVTQPYCPQLRDILIKVASKSLTKFWDKAVQVCVEGPRFETPAEITMFKILGGDIVGMTSSPEVFLAKELGICYASLSVISNFAAGLQNKISAEEVLKTSSKTKSTICQLIRDAVRTIPERRSCGCASSLEGARI
jgi:5'-methylthioadenosine phosphorylase